MIKKLLFSLILVLTATVTFSQGSESFTNSNTGGVSSSYVTRTWTGDNGLTWTATNARNDEGSGGSTITGMTGDYIIYRNTTGILSCSGITNGCTEISFKYAKAFTALTNPTFALFINGVQYGSVITAGSNAAQTASYTVNIPGTFNLEIRQLTASDQGRIAIDDILWTSFSATPCVTPTAQPTTLSFSTTTTTSISGSFTVAPGTDKYLVVRSLSSSFTAPVNGVTYAPGAVLGDGTVLASGSAANFTATGLAEGTTYYFYVFSYNDLSCSGGPSYLSASPLSGNTITAVPAPCTTPATATNLSLTPATTSVTGTFTSAGASKYLVIQTSTPGFTGTISNGTVYAINSNVGNGKVVSYNATTTFTASGLTPVTAYYFFVFSVNDVCAGEPFYSSTSLDGNTTTTTNTIPTGYYDAALGLSCALLKTALSNIITTGHTQNNYSSLDDVQFLTTDDRLNDAGDSIKVYDMYSDNPSGAEPYTFTFSQFNVGSGSDGEGNGWNKEHSFPNSWFSATSSTDNIPGADLHHIFPTDMDVNSLRGNYPFGVVSSATTTTANGGKLGSSGISFPGYSGPVFEPIDGYKGDFARATLYMVTRYQSEQPTWEGLQPTGDVVMDGTTWPSVEPAYLQMLISWHNADPVSAKEIERNNEVFGYQNNRNPFIDHPEFVGLVWGPACSVLPVSLTGFKGQLVAKKVLLRWAAENPTGFSHFVIEKSIDGISFNEAGMVALANVLNFDFTDYDLPQAPNVYYRLRMVDIDGSFKLSQVIKIKLTAEFAGALIYPNPVTTNLQVKYADPLPVNSTLQVIDARGGVVLKQSLNAGVMLSNTNVGGLTAGKYYILISNNKQQIRETFIIIK